MGTKLNIGVILLAFAGIVLTLPNWRAAVVAGIVVPGAVWLLANGAGRFLRGPDTDIDT